MFKDWTRFEKWFLFLGILANCIATYLFKGTWIDFTYTLLYFTGAILLAKGKVINYIITFIATFFYAYISYKNGYYGEIIITFGMTLPLCIYGFINWLKNLYNKDTVKIKDMSKKELTILSLSQCILVFGYYFLLKAFNTSQLFISSLSVIDSLFAIYLGIRRSIYSFYFYVVNDLILIALWGIPVISGSLILLPMVFNPIINLINDMYGIHNWKKLEKIQGGK